MLNGTVEKLQQWPYLLDIIADDDGSGLDVPFRLAAAHLIRNELMQSFGSILIPSSTFVGVPDSAGSLLRCRSRLFAKGRLSRHLSKMLLTSIFTGDHLLRNP